MLVAWSCFLQGSRSLSNFQFLDPCPIECICSIFYYCFFLPFLTLACFDTLGSWFSFLTGMNSLSCHCYILYFLLFLKANIFRNPSSALFFSFLFLFSDNLRYFYCFTYHLHANDLQISMSSSNFLKSWRIQTCVPIACWIFPPGCHSGISKTTAEILNHHVSFSCVSVLKTLFVESHNLSRPGTNTTFFLKSLIVSVKKGNYDFF